jgi:Fe-S-cluster containining protein
MTYDCQQCGACCVDYLDPFGAAGYVQLNPDEPESLRRLGLPIVEIDGREFLGTVEHECGGSVCVAFAGSVGQQCGCSIYEQRPDRCRRYEVGSVQCRAARFQSGLPV